MRHYLPGCQSSFFFFFFGGGGNGKVQTSCVFYVVYWNISRIKLSDNWQSSGNLYGHPNIIFELAMLRRLVYLFNMLYKYDCQLSAKQMHFPIFPAFSALSLALSAQNGAFYVSL